MRFKPGDKVTYDGGDGPAPECGIILHTWVDDHGDEDCYIAFFGFRFPEPGIKPEKPYVLRYFAKSLTAV